MTLPTPLQAFNTLAKSSDKDANLPDDQAEGEPMSGAQALIRSLEELGVQVVFGLPGGQILPAFDALDDSTSFRFVLTRQEQAAGQAAQGYAISTGQVGVCMLTSGPGATNMVTPIADAAMDSVPLVVITGQVGTASIGTDAFQEADIVGITYPIVKHSYQVTRAQDIPRIVSEAFYIASTGRPGPVLIDLPKSVQEEEMNFSWPQKMILPGYKTTTKAHGRVLQVTVDLLLHAHKPVLYLGGGTAKARASKEVEELAELTGAPVVTTLSARSVIADRNKHMLGMPGMHGSVAANAALQASDLLVAIGARFDDRVTGRLDGFAQHAKVVHIDIDPAEIGKNRPVDVPIVGDAKQVVHALNQALQKALTRGDKADLQPWWDTISAWKTHYPATYETAPEGELEPQWVLEELSRQASPDTLWVTDVGQHQMWASQYIDFQTPYSFVSSCGLGTLGFGLPAAIGTAIGAQAGRPVWLIEGDGGFQVSSQELASARQAGLPIKIALINNSSYGMIRQWQTLFYQGHHCQTDLQDQASPYQVPDFVKLAEAYDCIGFKATNRQEAQEAISQAQQVSDRPVLIDFRVWKDAKVWPMVPPGQSNDAIVYLPGISPLEADQ